MIATASARAIITIAGAVHRRTIQVLDLDPVTGHAGTIGRGQPLRPSKSVGARQIRYAINKRLGAHDTMAKRSGN